MDGTAIAAYIQQVLVPLEPEAAAILDNLATHCNQQSVKAHLRRIEARSVAQMSDAIIEICELFTPQNAGNVSRPLDTHQVKGKKQWT